MGHPRRRGEPLDRCRGHSDLVDVVVASAIVASALIVHAATAREH
jgi:hypothetical protein